MENFAFRLVVYEALTGRACNASIDRNTNRVAGSTRSSPALGTERACDGRSAVRVATACGWQGARSHLCSLPGRGGASLRKERHLGEPPGDLRGQPPRSHSPMLPRPLSQGGRKGREAAQRARRLQGGGPLTSSAAEPSVSTALQTPRMWGLLRGGLSCAGLEGC